MRKGRITISAGGVLLLAALYFFMDTLSFAALMLAAAAHECGHLAALRAAGCRVRGFSADAGGAVIERRGGAGPVWELAAGPAAGFAYALTASLIGGELDSVLLLRSAGMSAVLSVFNLLPSPPLDGGRMVQLVFGNKAAEIAGLLTASAVFLIGFAALVTGHGAALFLAGALLLLKNV